MITKKMLDFAVNAYEIINNDSAKIYKSHYMEESDYGISYLMVKETPYSGKWVVYDNLVKVGAFEEELLDFLSKSKALSNK